MGASAGIGLCRILLWSGLVVSARRASGWFVRALIRFEPSIPLALTTGPRREVRQCAGRFVPCRVVCCARLAVSGRREWAAAHPDPSPLADKIGQLSDEIDQLRGLLRQQGTEPEEDTARPWLCDAGLWT